jgi:hypothetical protein
VIITVATTGLLVVLIAVKTGMSPEPELANPMLGSEFVHV